MSHRLCVCNLSALVWDRCGFHGQKSPVIVQPFITALHLSKHIQTLVNKRTRINHFQCSYTHNTQTDGHNNNNTKRRVFLEDSFIFQACFCHYHSWTTSCLKSAGCRTLKQSLCRVGCAERDDWESRCYIWGQAHAREKYTRVCVYVGGGPHCLIIFHFHVLLLHHLVQSITTLHCVSVYV